MSDPELLELFKHDAEALAIVDAIAATHGRPRRGRQLAAIGSAALLLAAIGAVILSGSSHAGVVERALSAINNKPVAHVRLVDTHPAAILVNLRTGERQPVVHVLDEWLSKDGLRRRIRDSFLGQPVTDIASTRHSATSGDDTAAFLVDYRHALATASASASKTVVSLVSQRGYELRYRNSRGRVVRVIVDQDTFAPRLVKFNEGPTLRITELRGAPRTELAAGPTKHLQQPSSVAAARPADPHTVAVANSLPLRLNDLLATNARLLELGLAKDRREVVPQLTYSRPGGSAELRITTSSRPYRALGWTTAYRALGDGFLLAPTDSLRRIARLDDKYLSVESSLPLEDLIQDIRSFISQH